MNYLKGFLGHYEKGMFHQAIWNKEGKTIKILEVNQNSIEFVSLDNNKQEILSWEEFSKYTIEPQYYSDTHNESIHTLIENNELENVQCFVKRNGNPISNVKIPERAIAHSYGFMEISPDTKVIDFGVIIQTNNENGNDRFVIYYNFVPTRFDLGGVHSFNANSRLHTSFFEAIKKETEC